jgi:hypothetical protein
MSHTLYNEAIADAKKLKQMAEEDAKNRIIDAITPRIRNLIESKILGESIPEEIEVDEQENSEEDVEDVEMAPVSLDPEPVSIPVDAGIGSEKPVVKIDPDGPVSVDLGDFEIEFNTNDEDEMVLDQDMAEVLKRATGMSANIEESIESLESRVNLVKEALTIAKSSGTPSQKRKITNLVESAAREAASIWKQLGLASQLGSDSAPERAKIDVIIKELKTMTDRKGRNIFDFLFESEDVAKLEEVGLYEEEEVEAEEADAEDEDLGAEEAEGPVDAEVEDAFLSLGDALGLDVETEEPAEEDEEGDEDEGEEMEEMATEADMDEVYEIDENTLRNELRRLRGLREETSGVEDPKQTAAAFGGGEVEDEPFVDVSEDQLLNALDDELGSVSESVKQEIVRRVRKASIQESRRSRRRSPARRNRRSVNEAANRKVAKLETQLNEMNIFNAKLLYANKLMQNKNLSTKQQRAIVEAMDSAKTVREAKLLYSSLTASMKKGKKSTLAENATKSRLLGASSRSTRSAAPANNGTEVDRWATLAGLKKDS